MDKTLTVKNKISAEQHFKIEKFRKDIRVTRPHKHNQYFEIIYLSAGSGDHWIDAKKYAIKPPVLFFINRDQLHYWNLQSEPEGYVMILKESFLQRSEDEALKQLLQRLWAVNCTYITDAAELELLFGLLEKQYAQQEIYRDHIIDGLLKVLISKMLTLGKSSSGHFQHNAPLYARYLDLLNTHANIHRRVSYFAGQLDVSPQNLNAACRKAVNLSAAQLIEERVLGEAKRLLLYTNNTVSEIAYLLEFTDPSYFVKYFKKHLQITPEAFRKQSFSK